MQKTFIIVCLIFFSLQTFAATEKDFVQITDNAVTYYTHKDITANPIKIGSDKIFYGSNSGSVDLKIYLKDTQIQRNYSIGIETHTGKKINVSKYKINKAGAKSQPTNRANSWKMPENFVLNSNLQEIEINLDFNATNILFEEIDIIVYDEFGNEVLRYDPFLSGCSYRQPITFNTNGIGLSGNVTNDHAIWFNIPASNTDFWNTESYGNGNGIRLADSTGGTDLNFHFTAFNATTDDANGFIRHNATFDATTDTTGYLYTSCANSNFQNEAGTYPAGYSGVHHLDGSSAYLDSTSNNHDETASTVTRNVGGKLGTAADFDGTNDVVTFDTTLGNFSTGDFTYYGWIRPDANTTQPALFGKRGALSTQWARLAINTPNSPIIFEKNAANRVSTNNILNAVWQQIGATRCSGTGQIYINGAVDGSSGSMTGDIDNSDFFQMGVWGSLSDDYDGRIDEVKLFNYCLSADEIKLIYNAENTNFVSYGAQESAPQVDANITYPNAAGTIFSRPVETMINIQWAINNENASTFLVDLNVGTLATDGSGTVVLNDINSISYCSTPPAPLNCSYSWNSNGIVDGTYFAKVKIIDGNTSDFDASDNNFLLLTIPASKRSNSCEIAERFDPNTQGLYYSTSNTYNISDQALSDNQFLFSPTSTASIQGGVMAVYADIVDSNQLTKDLNAYVTLYNVQAQVYVFRNQLMQQITNGSIFGGITSSYILKREIVFNNGDYVLFIFVDANCSKSFNVSILGQPTVTNRIIGAYKEVPIKKTTSTGHISLAQSVNSSSNNNLTLIIGVMIVIIILIGGVWFAKRK